MYNALQYEEGILSLGATLHCTALLNPWKSLSGQPTLVDPTLTLSWEVSVTAPLKGGFLWNSSSSQELYLEQSRALVKGTHPNSCGFFFGGYGIEMSSVGL